MDKIDKDILRELFWVNCRASYRFLARKFGVSPNTIKNRITKMIEQGVIIRFLVSLNREMTGTEMAFGLVFTDGTENSKEFVSQIGKSPVIGNVLTLSAIEGGAYFVLGYCRESKQLAELGAMLRGFDRVRKVELHMAFFPWRGNKIEFSKSQLKVIRCLHQDARMKIEDISNRTGMAAKTVRRILRELEPGNGIDYSCRVDLSAGGLVDALLRIEWDDKMTSLDEMFHWIEKEYSDDLWVMLISSSESVMFVSLILDNILDLEPISSRIRKAPFVKSTTALTTIAQASFEIQQETMLEEMLDKAGV